MFFETETIENPIHDLFGRIGLRIGSILETISFDEDLPILQEKDEYGEKIRELKAMKGSQVSDFLEMMASGKQLLIIDVEANVLSRRDTVDIYNNRIVNLAGTVIGPDFRIRATTNAYIRPEWQQLSSVFEKNWGLNEISLERDGVSFSMAYSELLEVFDPETMILASWNTIWMVHLIHEAKRFGLPPIFTGKGQKRPFHIQNIVAKIIEPEIRSFYFMRHVLNINYVDLIEDASTRSIETGMMLYEVFG